MNYDTFRIAQNGQRLIVGNFDEPFLIQKIKETEYHEKVTQKTAYRSFNGKKTGFPFFYRAYPPFRRRQQRRLAEKKPT